MHSPMNTLTMDDPSADTALGVETPHHEDEDRDGHEHDVVVNGDDTEDIAFAAEAAAQAVEAADAVSQQQRLDDSLLRCRICGRGNEEGRPILRFLPVDHDVAAANAAPAVMSFTDDIALHIFCGKTASILPSVNQPELEILTKAGLKNKHGIGPEVNAALARTRCAILAQEGAKEKHFYLVREFEAHLAAIRRTHISFVSDRDPYSAIPPHQVPSTHHPHHTHPNHHHPHLELVGNMVDPHHTHHLPHQYSGHPDPAVDTPSPTEHVEQPKQPPIRAAAGQIHKPGRRQHHQQDQEVVPQPQPGPMTEDGKVRCGCGGTHWPTGTPRGAASWRSHVMTKRHQKWMEQNGLLGAV